MKCKFSFFLMILILISSVLCQSEISKLSTQSGVNNSPPTFNTKYTPQNSKNVNYQQILNQIEEKKKIIKSIYQSYGANGKPESPSANPTLLTNSISYQPTGNLTDMDQKLIYVLDNVQKIMVENQKLKPLLKTIVDMQFFTFQKIKKYQETIDELNSKLNLTQGTRSNVVSRRNLRNTESQNKKEVDLSPESVSNMDDDELYSLLEKSENTSSEKMNNGGKVISSLKSNQSNQSKFLDP